MCPSSSPSANMCQDLPAAGSKMCPAQSASASQECERSSSKTDMNTVLTAVKPEASVKECEPSSSHTVLDPVFPSAKPAALLKEVAPPSKLAQVSAPAKSAQPNQLSRMRAVIAERLADELDHHHVEEEQLEYLSELDAVGANTSGLASLGCLRSAALQLLTETMMQTRTSLQCWFHAVRVFDASAESLGHDPTILAVLTRASACWLLCLKRDHVDCHSSAQVVAARHCGCLLTRAAVISAEHGGTVITKNEVLAHERALFMKHCITLNLPTVPKWFSMISLRFDIATSGRCQQHISSNCNWAGSGAVACVTQGGLVADCPPRTWAVGIFFVVLLAAGVLPLDAMLSPSDDREKWLHYISNTVGALRTRSNPQSSASASSQSSTFQVAAPLLEPKVALAALEFAAGIPVSEARAGALSVVELICKFPTGIIA